MHNFSGKDFFGDPIWPSDFGAENKKLQDSEQSQPSSAKKSPFGPEPNENSCSNVSLHGESPDAEDLEKSFIAN